MKYYSRATFSVNDDIKSPKRCCKRNCCPNNDHEISLSHIPNKRCSLEDGLDIITPKETTLLNKNNYQLVHYILDTNYFITPETRLDLVARYNHSDYKLIKNNYNVLSLGFRYNFDYGKNFN